MPLKLIDRCVIHGLQTRLDSGVLIKLSEAGATTVLMSPPGVRRVALVLGPQHNDAAVRLAQSQHVLDDKACCEWAHALVRAKLNRQRRTLQAARPDARKPLFDALQTLNNILHNLCQPEPGLDRLREFEGAAAHAYFAGLDPLLGFYHRPAFGRESLASDLIKPLRPAIDLWVWELLRSRTLREDHFSIDKGACLLGKAERAIYYAEFEKNSALWRRWRRGQCQLLAHNLRREGGILLSRDDELDDETWD